MQENYLAKWLNNELSEEELKAFQQTDEYAAYQKILEASSRLQGPQLDRDAAWEDLRSRTVKPEVKVIRLNPMQKIMRVAAAVAVVFVASYFYINSLDEVVTAEYAQRQEFALPDASEVFLNSGSELTFSERNWDKERRVSLEGEAFFKVAKGKRFTVETDAGAVSVLGTEFNVEHRNGYFEVSCYEGLVAVLFQSEEYKLPAGKSFRVINGEIRSEDTMETAGPTWLRNESSFKSIPFKYVLAELERQYDVKVSASGVDTEQLFTGTFSNTNLNLALESISAPSRIQYKLEGNKVLIYAEATP